MGHLGKILSHTAIPATEALSFALGHLIITNIVAVTGGAHLTTATTG